MQRNVALDRLNTFGLPARAARYWRVDDVGSLVAQARAGALRGPRLVLGGGSNLIFTGDVDRLVLHVVLKGREVVGERGDAILVAAGAGEPWHDFVRWTLDQGVPGLENLSLIPGTVGATPIQNIGAYGLEIAERFDHLEAIDLDSGDRHRFDVADCRFGYRDSIFKHDAANRYLITRVVFRLPKRWRPLLTYADLQRWFCERHIDAPNAHQISDAVIAIRQQKLPDPAILGNAGSFFKNPVVDADTAKAFLARHPDAPHYPQPDGRTKLAAGWLIERCGWRGKNLGPVGCHDRQALVLVNRGGATGADVKRLAARISEDISAQFGVTLETEPGFV